MHSWKGLWKTNWIALNVASHKEPYLAQEVLALQMGGVWKTTDNPSQSSAAGHSGRHNTALAERLVQDNKTNSNILIETFHLGKPTRMTTVGDPFTET